MLMRTTVLHERDISAVESIEANLASIACEIEKRDCHNLLHVAEDNLRSWVQVLKSKQILPIRLGAGGFPAEASCFYTSWQRADCLEYNQSEEGLSSFPSCLKERISLLGLSLAEFHAKKALPDSHACDSLMMNMAYFSRFLSSWLSAAAALFPQEMKHIHTAIDEPPPLPWRSKPTSPMTFRHKAAVSASGVLLSVSSDFKQLRNGFNFCQLIWEQYVLWEPWLNQGIVAWRQNTLKHFLDSAQKLSLMISYPSALLHEHLPPFGWPFRRQKQSRFLVEEEFIRYSKNCRMRSGFRIAMNNLQSSIRLKPDPQTLEAVNQEAIHFVHMMYQNRFVIAREPFLRVPKSYGQALIRKVSSLHPYLISPNEFYKQAMLCYTNAYHTASGIHDEAYLQIQLLWRTLACHPSIEAPKTLAQPLEKALIAWDANNKSAFNKKLFRFAEKFVAWGEVLQSAPWKHVLSGLRTHYS